MPALLASSGKSHRVFKTTNRTLKIAVDERREAPISPENLLYLIELSNNVPDNPQALLDETHGRLWHGLYRGSRTCLVD